VGIDLNVLFIMTDQQRADSIGPNRHPCADYPQMEKLRSESVSFANFFTAASPCVPSRQTFLTGRHSWQLGVQGNAKFLMEGTDNWMQTLRNHGFRCVSVGKTHLVHAGSFHLQIPPGDSFGDQGGWNHFEPAPSPEQEELYYDIHTARRACAALDKLKKTEPFAMFVGFHAPHEPYVMPEKYLAYCKPEDVPLPGNRDRSEYSSKSEGYRRRFDLFKNKFGEITDDMVRRGIAGHHCLLKMVDDCLGMIMDKLREQQMLDDTLVIFTSDHGELLGEHYLFNKAGTSYESEIRIPFMIRFPDGYKKGECVSNLASSIDFVPTLYELLGIDPDVSLPGYSLMPAIRDGSELRSYITTTGTGTMGIRTEKHKLWYHAGDKDGELYDLKDDPSELRNLYHAPEAGELRRELFELMLHARVTEDNRGSRPTRSQIRLHDEAKTAFEPEIV
jgi:arylsulfatase A-like enzyme